jgi:general secretion pathway protein D
VEATYTKNISGATSLIGSNMFGGLASGVNNSSIPSGAGLYTITGNDFSATLRAIQYADKAEVLSRPSVMVRNNQPANITIGKKVPYITSTSYNSTSGTPNNSYSYQNVGVILQVQPFITGTNLVEMIVSPEMSSLSSQSVTISAGVDISIINTRSANTVVVTPDQTPIIIGGLMNKDKSVTDQKIPLLGDIPWLGYLFKRHKSTISKTELIVFLTPYIVRSPGEVNDATDDEMGRQRLINKDIKQDELDRYLGGLTLKTNIETKVEKK